MDRIRRLENPIRHYAWGSRTFLAELQGRPSPTAEPEAELWIGAHPSSPSSVVTDEGLVPLDAWIARDPERILGADVARRFGGELPFLVKILAVERPLSLQAHPDAEQARAGFERENAAGIPLDAPERSYRDPHGKPELVCALTPFEALVGFREPAEILARFDALGVAALEPALEPLRARPDETGWRTAFELLLRLTPPTAREALRKAAERVGATDDSSRAWLSRLASAHPGDPAALAPVYLNHVSLASGESAFLAPGTPHCYLRGAAVEVQASSDNVLRAGLTEKPVDPDELLAILQAGPSARGTAGLRGLEACNRFRCSVLETGDGVAGPTIVLCTAGSVAIRDIDGDASERLNAGASMWVPANSGGRVDTGGGVAFQISVPKRSP